MADRPKTLYLERYRRRAAVVTRDEALRIAGEADVIFAVEQGEIEMRWKPPQRRIVVTMTFERIIHEDGK